MNETSDYLERICGKGCILKLKTRCFIKKKHPKYRISGFQTWIVLLQNLKCRRENSQM